MVHNRAKKRMTSYFGPFFHPTWVCFWTWGIQKLHDQSSFYQQNCQIPQFGQTPKSYCLLYHIIYHYIVSPFIQLYRVISFKMVGFILYFCFVKSSSISRYHTWFDRFPDKHVATGVQPRDPPSPQGLRGEAPAMQAAAKGHSALLWLHLDVAHQAVVVGGDDHVPRPKKDKKPPSYWLITSIPAAIYLQPYDLWYYVYDWTYTSNYSSFKGENEDWPWFTSIF